MHSVSGSDNQGLSKSVSKKVHDSFHAQGLMATLGATMTDLAAGSCRIEAPIRAETGQQQGFAHAGLTFAIGDSAAGYAALSLMPEDCEVVTAEMKIHLLAPAAGDTLVAQGKVIRPGRRLMVVQADVYSTGQDPKHVAIMTGTMVPVPSAL